MRAVLGGLRRALRLGLRQPLARVRAWHGVQDPLDERRRLQHRVVPGDAEPGGLALEPCAAPYRHLHRRARSGDRLHAAAGGGEARARVHRGAGGLGVDGDPAPAGVGQAQRRREGLYPRERALEGGAGRAHPYRDLCRDHRGGAGVPVVDSADGDRAAADLRRLAHGDDRAPAAWRAGRQRHRPSAEQPHGLHEPGVAVHLLEHELSHRAPHVPDGAVSRAAAAARAGEGGLSAAEHLDPRRLPRDVPGGEAAAVGPGILYPPRAAADGRPYRDEFHNVFITR